MKNSEIRALSIDELKLKIKSEKEGLQKLKFAHAVSPIENPNKIKETRKLVARLMTALATKELENA